MRLAQFCPFRIGGAQLAAIALYVASGLAAACGQTGIIQSSPTTSSVRTADSGNSSGTPPVSAVIEQDSGAGSGTPVTQAAPSRGPTPILLMLGGYTSCTNSFDKNPTPVGTRLVTMAAAIHTALSAAGGAAPLTVIACFGVDPSLVYFQLSTMADFGPQQAAVADFIAQMAQLAATVDRPQVAIVGHSYGGWLALKTAQELPATLPINALVTLDPISETSCSVANFVSADLSGQAAAGCTGAPTDWGDLSNLVARVGGWDNFWENNSLKLHSGVIAGAQNVQEQEAGSGFDPHSAVASDPAVIAQATSLIKAQYARALAAAQLALK